MSTVGFVKAPFSVVFPDSLLIILLLALSCPFHLNHLMLGLDTEAVFLLLFQHFAVMFYPHSPTCVLSPIQDEPSQSCTSSCMTRYSPLEIVLSSVNDESLNCKDAFGIWRNFETLMFV